MPVSGTNINAFPMIKYLTLLLAAALLCCQQQPAIDSNINPLPPVGTFTGLIRYDKGICNFTDCTTKALYLICDSTMSIPGYYKKACQPAECPDESVFAIVKARLFKGADPHSDPGILAIIGIDSMAGQNWSNTCVPYEFWCTGTEPFWSLHISKAEQGLFFKNMGDETGKTFDWSPPVQSGNTLTYTVKNRIDSRETMTVTITKEACNDGMSDLNFNYSATLKSGKEGWKGCGVKWGELLPKTIGAQNAE